AWIVVDGCRFAGRGTFIALENACHEVRLTRNLFVRGAVGLGFKMEDAGAFRRVCIANNTFFKTNVWLNLGASSLDQVEMRIERNLLVQTRRVSCDGDLGNTGWFRDNWWELPEPPRVVDDNARQAMAQLAEVKSLELLARDPASPDFARPAPLSQ